jgi:5-methylcytosine-specific restriction endonuclease McrA
MPRRIPGHRPARLPDPSRHRDYDRHARDRESRLFYPSTTWRKMRAIQLRASPLCERCLAEGLYVPATVVHHRIERRDRPELTFDQSNLESLCSSCHSRHHATDQTHA